MATADRESIRETTEKYLNANKAAAVNACTEMVQQIYVANCGANGSQCFSACVESTTWGKNYNTGTYTAKTTIDNSVVQEKFGDFMFDAMRRYVKVSRTGQVVKSHMTAADQSVSISDGTNSVNYRWLNDDSTDWKKLVVSNLGSTGAVDRTKIGGWYMVPCTNVLDMKSSLFAATIEGINTACGSATKTYIENYMKTVFTGWK
jgi:hypothetical protein